jgi:uncharacterized protein YndB with AHSA1/START domain
MERTTERLSVERELEIAASPETVWQFFVDPEKALRWWGTTVEIDARVDGAYRVEVNPGRTVSGVFVELEPPTRLVYTFGWEEGSPLRPGASIVEIELRPSPQGTTLRFVHRDLPDEETATSHTRGWDHYLERLSVAAAGGDPGTDPWLSAER